MMKKRSFKVNQDLLLLPSLRTGGRGSLATSPQWFTAAQVRR